MGRRGDSLCPVLQEEHNNLPARVSIVSLPAKVELRSKSLFSVHEVHMYWQQQGKYLAVHVRFLFQILSSIGDKPIAYGALFTAALA